MRIRMKSVIYNIILFQDSSYFVKSHAITLIMYGNQNAFQFKGSVHDIYVFLAGIIQGV